MIDVIEMRETNILNRRQEELLKETFEYDTPSMVLSAERLDMEVGGEEEVGGSITVSHPEGKKLRGFVYSSNPCMIVEPEEFFNSRAVINYRTIPVLLSPGSMIEGNLIFCTDIGQKIVPYTIKKTEKTLEHSLLCNEDLALEARNDFSRACGIFASEEYRYSLENASSSDRSLYQSLENEKVRERSLEEYLIGTGMKEPVELSIEEDETIISDQREDVLGSLTVKKNTWGYFEMEVSADGHFLRLDKKLVTANDFIGNSYNIRYIIDSKFLHMGRNWGRIIIHTVYQTLTFQVLVERNIKEEDLRRHRLRSMMIKKAESLYIDYRLGRIGTRKWAERTRSVIGNYKRAGGDDARVDLLYVYTLQIEGRNSSALRELHRVGREFNLERDSAAYAAWLGLSASLSADQSYIKSVKERVRGIFAGNSSSPLIFWITLYLLKDENNGDSGRINSIIRQLGTHTQASSILCLEGAIIASRNPFLLHEWSIGAALIVNYAVKEGIATESLFLHSCSLIRRRGTYEHITLRVLERCWESSHLNDVLEVCTQMAINAHKRGEKYFAFYQMALSHDLKVNGLYEYYIDTLDTSGTEMVPLVVARYLALSDTIDWRKKACIYRGLSDREKDNPQIFSLLKPDILKFILSQLRMTRVNEDLAILYDRYLTRSLLTKALSKNLVLILLTFEISCRNPIIKKAIVQDIRQSKASSSSFKEGKAYVRIYSEKSRIVLEDSEGHRYASTYLYRARHLLDSPRLMEICLQMAPDDMHLVLFFTMNPESSQPVTGKTLSFYLSAVTQTGVSEDYRASLRRWLLDYYDSNPLEETTVYFLKHIDADSYVHIGYEKLISLYSREGMYEQAWNVIVKYGIDGLKKNDLIRICSQMVLVLEYEKDRMLVGYCAMLLEEGMAEEHILVYLLMYYTGPVELMKTLWNKGKDYELETLSLEKRILGLIIFSRTGSNDSEDIYLSYRRSLGNRRLCQSYVILRCYEYLVKGLPVSEIIFNDCMDDLSKGGRLPDVCAISLLKYLSGLPMMTKEQEKEACGLLKIYGLRGMRFSFFQKFPVDMRRDLCISDKVFFEITSSPESTVRLFYKDRDASDAEFAVETMRDVYGGIRVREFILFEGEEVECYTEETRKNGEKVISGHTIISCGQTAEAMNRGRYGMITQMSRELASGNEVEFSDSLVQYRQMDSIVGEIFTLM